MRSLDTARRILAMASSLGVRAIRVVANKVRPENLQTLRIRMRENGVPLDLTLSYREEFASRDLDGAGVFEVSDPTFEADILRMLQAV
jgi:CO dehydrogenase nickel-insertion accessory protein CooC1